MSRKKGGVIKTPGAAILAAASAVGKQEHEGPLGSCFDYFDPTDRFGVKTWEKAESEMQRIAFAGAMGKLGVTETDIDALFAGDLLNQCVGSAYGLLDFDVPYFGLYGACSTAAEGLALAAMAVSGGMLGRAAAVTSSHNAAAERQYRSPLEYGGQRPPTSQWTVTGAGAAVVTAQGSGVRITHVTAGRIVDAGIDDANNMGAAMAPAAYDTLRAHFADTGRAPEYYDAIFTGDLGALGHDILQSLFAADGVTLGARYMDCGVLIYDLRTQDVHAGGSGCGCSASVLCAHILPAMRRGVWKRVLFAATGALMSPTSAQQGQPVPGICHAVALETED